ncbi:hypothetical protein H0H87_011876 [Tephrocybe sp. NHM501043]|nr:hypothetical protein H0H87_011876 [Tephrocybe sp. NHM501043]
MGKGKKALKTYKAMKPWPPDDKHPSFITNVAAWIEFMLREEYPEDSKAHHQNIIVELSGSVEVQPYIGKHVHDRFLSNSERFKVHNLDRTDWTARYPNWNNYDPSYYPFKENYPIPEPAPLPSYEVNYAKRPRNVAVVPVAAMDYQLINGAPKSLHIKREEQGTQSTLTKRDPYEEDEDAVRHLKGASQDLLPKQEQSVEYELLAAFSSLPPETFNPLPSVKTEEELDARSHRTRFSKSESSTTLATDFGELHPGSSSIRIKPEPKDEDMLVPLQPSPLRKTSDSRRERSTTLASEEAVRVKSEPRDTHTLPSFDPRPRHNNLREARGLRVKPEPQEKTSVLAIPSRGQTLDPRLARRADAGCSVNGRAFPPPPPDPRLARHGAGEHVHIKPEPRDISSLLPEPATQDPRVARRTMIPDGKRRVEDESDTGRMKRIKSEWQ